MWCLFVGYFMEFVTWFFEFAYWLLPDFANAPGPCGDRGEMAMAFARSLPSCTPYVSCCPFGPLYSVAVQGAAGHNRGEAVERQPLARTQGRNLDRSLTFKSLLAVCRVSFNPQGQTSGLKGTVPRTGLPKTADTPQRKCSQSARLEERAATRVTSVAHGAGVQGDSRSTRRIQGRATREPTRSPRGRQCEYPSQGDHPQNWRATSQGPAGALYTFNTDGVLAFSVHIAYVPAELFLLYYVTLLTCHMRLFPAVSFPLQESTLRDGGRLPSSIAALWYLTKVSQSVKA